MADSPSSPANSAAIPTISNRAYDLMKHGEGRESRHEYEVPAAFSPASKPLKIASQPLPGLPAKEKDRVYYNIPGDQGSHDS